MEGLKSLCTIDAKLLLIKMHYLLMFGGAGGALPYFSLYGKSIGINGTSVGLSITVSTFLTTVSRPFIGSLVDCFRNVKLFILSLLIIYSASTLCFTLIPPIPEEMSKSVNTTELMNSNRTLLENFYDQCTKENQANISKNCELLLGSLNASVLSITNLTEEAIHSAILKVNGQNRSIPIVDGQNISIIFETTSEPFTNIKKNSLNDFITKLILNNSSEVASTFMYESYQVWVFAILLIISYLGFSNSMCLTDVACYSGLGERRELYGQQRLWGTIGWAVACALGGYLNELSTVNNERKIYSSGFYILFALMPLDFAILSKVRMDKVKPSTTMCSDVKKVFLSFKITAFAVGVTIIGFLSAIPGHFELWYLQELGAHQTLMGAVVFVQCSVEVLFFVVSGWIVNKLGGFNCLVCSFLAFGVRFGLHSVITDPWWALAINTTHGVTFAIFHAATTNFASVHAPEGVEGTMLGIFGGLTDGLGVGTGSLIVGMLFDAYGGRFTIRIASALSFTCAVFFVCLNIVFYRCSINSRNDSTANGAGVILKTIN